MSLELITLYILLQIKHWYIDFAAQTPSELEHKGIYGSMQGMTHSIKHGIGTLFCILAITGQGYFLYALILAVMDFGVHYHIDYIKMKHGESNIQDPKFWNHLGLDQMAHQLTYLFILTMVF
jgi:hypothetical protein